MSLIGNVTRLISGGVLACVVGLGVVGNLSAAEPDFRTWDQYLGGVDSAQYSALDQINKDNVDRLQVAWTYETGRGGPSAFNPLVVDGVMYAMATRGAIVALDAATGEEIWTHANDGRVGQRGMSYWQSADGADRRLFYMKSGFLTALDAATGETVTSFGTDGQVDLRDGLEGDTSDIRPLQTSNPGRVFEDLIIMSLPASGAQYVSASADIHAYDVRTGALVWTFHTVPREGEFGADTWPDNGRGVLGGAHNWSESTVDAERGIIYIPTGTARFDFYGANRHGRNLFADSLIALDARTGERLWHYQIVHHDLWDYDLPAAPKLVTIKREGEAIPAIVQPTKHGYLFVFNRETGEPVWPIEERPVPQSDVPGEESWPTQPIPTAPPPFARQSFTEADINPYLSDEDKAKARELLKTYRNDGLFTPPSMEGTLMMPGYFGGTNWGMSAADPEQGRFYVISRALPSVARLVAPEEGEEAPPPNAGPDFVPYQAPVDFMLMENGMSPIGPPWSEIVAYDLNEGSILWRIPNGEVTRLAEKGSPVRAVTSPGVAPWQRRAACCSLPHRRTAHSAPMTPIRGRCCGPTTCPRPPRACPPSTRWTGGSSWPFRCPVTASLACARRQRGDRASIWSSPSRKSEGFNGGVMKHGLRKQRRWSHDFRRGEPACGLQ